jgi:hypothetical protein
LRGKAFDGGVRALRVRRLLDDLVLRFAALAGNAATVPG